MLAGAAAGTAYLQAGDYQDAAEKAGACLVELDSDPNDLWNKVEQLLADEPRLSAMASAAKGLGMPDAADQIAQAILEKENL